MSDSREAADFLIRQFMKHEHMLLSYISAILMDYHRAEDVLQETASVLIRRADEYRNTQNFWRLAREIARRQAIANMQKAARAPKLVPEEVLDAIESEFDNMQKDYMDYKQILLDCIRKLPSAWQLIITERYWKQSSVKQVALALDRSSKTISVALVRARARLAECVTRTMRLGRAV